MKLPTIALCLVYGTVTPAFAVDHPWLGLNGDWSQVANWNAASVPGSDDKAILNVGKATLCAATAIAALDGDLPKALRSIRARTLLMPGDNNLYFQVDDSRAAMCHLQSCNLSCRRGTTPPASPCISRLLCGYQKCDSQTNPSADQALAAAPCSVFI